MAHISFDSVSKIYSRQSRQFSWRYFLQTIGKNRRSPIHAIREVSFEVADGGSLAIVGHNGAGKSTILNLAAGLTRPEKGSISVEGHVMALLELGSGFHHDLTGAENLRLNAALCGLTKKETLELFDRIVEFSEIGDFIDEPLRTYSQGMTLRLAFSVAVHVNPDILLIDEMLVVGDKDFQRKCISRILQMKREGRILLCVSHAAEVLRHLCDDALWIESGRVVMQGPAPEVLDAYQSGGSAVNAG
jgi:ABC-type polysaccharide/polyol phosphate transport system ATPase subunit